MKQIKALTWGKAPRVAKRPLGDVGTLVLVIEGLIIENSCNGYYVKSFLIFAITCGLLLMRPGPMSVCSLLSSMTGECAAADTHARCENMEMDMPAGQMVAARFASCCATLQAPLPELQHGTATTSLQQAPTASVVGIAETMRFDEAASMNIPQVDSSPPPLQTLLCTFLI
jgi:hypothetical protein